MSDDELIFQKEMQDVKRLKSESVVLPKPREPNTPGQIYRRMAAQQPLPGDENFLPGCFVESVHPGAVLSFKREGIQNGVFRNLQSGRYVIDAVLDLHMLSIEQARVEVFNFIRDCTKLEVRTALINHGKGARRQDAQAVIKSCVARWLPMFHEVLAFHSAQGFHGGTGAVYILLRKSEKARERVRESLGLKSEKSSYES
jgi:DNA-nicking Smr family endonuclease